jgi:CheY-like chemotaxis protein
MAGKKLLVADDSLTIQKVIRLALSNEGYEIHSVSDGNNTLQQISTFRPDVVLIDVSLPGRSAFEIKREINHLDDCRHIKFILMYTVYEKFDEAQFDEVGFQARLTKPVDPAHLRDTLAEALASSFRQPSPNPTGDELPPLPVQMDSSRDEFANYQIHEKLSYPEQESGLDPTSRSASPLEGRSVPRLEDALEDPIEPESLPPLPEIPADLVSQLWELNETKKATPFEPSESDIRHLADATLKPKNTQDFDWETSESLPTLDFSALETSSHDPSADSGNKPHSSDFPQPKATSPFEGDVFSTTLDIDDKMEPPTHPFNAAEIEKMIQQQVQSSLEKMARNLLPSMAEKMIKEEIHRLLSDPEPKA